MNQHFWITNSSLQAKLNKSVAYQVIYFQAPKKIAEMCGITIKSLLLGSPKAHMPACIYPSRPSPTPLDQSKSPALSAKPRVFLGRTELPLRSGRFIVENRGGFQIKGEVDVDFARTVPSGKRIRAASAQRERPPAMAFHLIPLPPPFFLHPPSLTYFPSLMFRSSISACLRVHDTRYG